jgi:DnaJ-class molecular chaperone
MNSNNYYEILGLSQSASKEEIKKKYRKLSLKYHPDRPNGNKEMFQKITQAYEVLSESNKKREYDRKQNTPNNKFNMEFFNQMFGMNPAHRMGASSSHLFRGNISLNIDKTYEISFQESWSGVVKSIVVERYSIINNMKMMEKEQLYIRIPAGIKNGDKIVLKGKGNKFNGRMLGDVKVHISVKNNTKFVRDSLDLILKKTITFKESLVGFKFELKHISGKKYSINNFDGKVIKDGYMKVVPKLGFWMEQNGTKTQGNLLIVFDVKYPDTLSKELRDKLAKVL